MALLGADAEGFEQEGTEVTECETKTGTWAAGSCQPVNFWTIAQAATAAKPTTSKVTGQ